MKREQEQDRGLQISTTSLHLHKYEAEAQVCGFKERQVAQKAEKGTGKE
jgi:hypothetical protein